MKKNLIMVGDAHFGYKSNSLEWLDNFSVFFEKILIPYLESLHEDDRKETILVFMGDMYQKKISIGCDTQYRVINIMQIIAKLVETHAIIGNHDTPKLKDREINNCYALGIIPDFHVHVNPHVLEFVGHQKVLLMPWVDTSTFPSLERDIIAEHSSCQYVIAHTEVCGFSYENKDVPEEERHLNLKDLAHLKKFYSGHIHKRQSKANVQFTGTPHQIRPVEWKNEVGFTTVDFSSMDSTGIPKETWIPNKLSPKYVKLDVYDLMEMPLDKLSAMARNNYLYIRLTIDDINNLDVNRIFNTIPETYKRLSQEVVTIKMFGEGAEDDDPSKDKDILEAGKRLSASKIDQIYDTFLGELIQVPHTKKEVITMTDNIRTGVSAKFLELLKTQE